MRGWDAVGDEWYDNPNKSDTPWCEEKGLKFTWGNFGRDDYGYVIIDGPKEKEDLFIKLWEEYEPEGYQDCKTCEEGLHRFNDNCSAMVANNKIEQISTGQMVEIIMERC